MRKLLITGNGGFVGRNFFEVKETICQSFGWELISHEIEYDLRDNKSLETLIEKTEPDGVIHLAGVSFVPDSFRDPEHTLQINLIGTLHLLQSLNRCGFKGSFLYVSSGDVYGLLSADDLPVKENHPARPLSPYGISKVAAELLCAQWASSEKFQIVIARPFNHIGRGQREDFVLPAMAKQIIQIKHGLQRSAIEVGDIDVTRDFLDVRDVITAYLLLLDKGINGEIYNVCSGIGQNIRNLIITLQRLADVDAELRQDPARFRPSEQKIVVGNNRKLIEATGWKPSVGLDESLTGILEDWEQKTHG